MVLQILKVGTDLERGIFGERRALWEQTAVSI
jgi:hypothetical protein